MAREALTQPNEPRTFSIDRCVTTVFLMPRRSSNTEVHARSLRERQESGTVLQGTVGCSGKVVARKDGTNIDGYVEAAKHRQHGPARRGRGRRWESVLSQRIGAGETRSYNTW